MDAEREGVAAAGRLALVLDLLGLGRTTAMAATWFETVLAAAERIDVSVNPAYPRLTAHAEGPPALAESILDVATGFQVTPEAIDELSAACSSLRPARLGCWLDVGDEHVDLGWRVLAGVATTSALALASPSAPLEALAAWFDAAELERVDAVGRSMGGDERVTELLFGLPGGDRLAQLEASRELGRALGAEQLPRSAVDAVASIGDTDVGAALAFTDAGLARFGVSAASPATELVLLLRSLVTDAGTDELALLEATIGGAPPLAVDCEQTAGGFGICLRYRLGAS